MPFFSILIPSYNRPEYLPRAVASVLASSFEDFELIVSDDKSPRQTEIKEALLRFAGDPRLDFVCQPENLGEARNRHFLMQRARGDYRIIIGDDDLLSAGALAVLQGTIARRPGYDIYLFGYSVVDEGDHLYETRRALSPFELSMGNRKTMKDLFRADLHPFWFYHPATFCFTATLHRDVVPNHSVGIGDDIIFLIDALLAGKRALVVPEVLFSYRKFIGGGAYGQINLSRTRLADVVTRRNILYQLLRRDGLPSDIEEFVRSREYRRRFLYDSIAIDPDVSEENLAGLDLIPEHLCEARAHWRARRGAWYRHWLQLRRVFAYVGYFGISGLAESHRIRRQRREYRRANPAGWRKGP